MNLFEIILIIFIIFTLICICCAIIILFASKYLTLLHYIYIIRVDGQNRKSNIVETFPNRVKCSNPSLNDSRKMGEIEKKPFGIQCGAQTADEDGEEKFYKKYKPYIPMGSTDEYNGIRGANFSEYNTNPNPYHLDMSLYSDNPKNIPVSANNV